MVEGVGYLWTVSVTVGDDGDCLVDIAKTARGGEVVVHISEILCILSDIGFYKRARLELNS